MPVIGGHGGGRSVADPQSCRLADTSSSAAATLRYVPCRGSQAALEPLGGALLAPSSCVLLPSRRMHLAADDEPASASASCCPSPSGSPPRPPVAWSGAGARPGPRMEPAPPPSAAAAVLRSLMSHIGPSQQPSEITPTAVPMHRSAGDVLPSPHRCSPSDATNWQAVFGSEGAAVVPMPPVPQSKRRSGERSGDMVYPRPRPLQVSVSHARGAVRAGGCPAPAVAPASSFRNAGREAKLAAAHLDGQARRLPPDRSTNTSIHRQRMKFSSPSICNAASLRTNPGTEPTLGWLSMSASSVVPIPSTLGSSQSQAS